MSDSAAAADLKRELRRHIRAGRSGLSDEQRLEARRGLTNKLSELVASQRARSFSCYLPQQTEPNTRGLLSWAAAEGIDALLPSSREDGLLDWIRPSGVGSITGAFGIEEPLGEILSPLAVSEVDIMFVPAAAVDQSGNRLGWGRGYFDRTLSSMERRPPVYAVVFDHEVLESLPLEPHDAPVDGVVTPERIIEF